MIERLESLRGVSDWGSYNEPPIPDAIIDRAISLYRELDALGWAPKKVILNVDEINWFITENFSFSVNYLFDYETYDSSDKVVVYFETHRRFVDIPDWATYEIASDRDMGWVLFGVPDDRVEDATDIIKLETIKIAIGEVLRQ